MRFSAFFSISLAAAAALPLLLISIPLTRRVSGIVEQGARRELSLLAERAVERAERSLNDIKTGAASLARDSDLERATRSVLFVDKADYLLRAFIKSHPLIAAIRLEDASHNVITAIPATPPSATDTWLEFQVESTLTGSRGRLLLLLSITALTSLIEENSSGATTYHLIEGALARNESTAAGHPDRAAQVASTALLHVSDDRVLSVVATEPLAVRFADVRATVRHLVELLAVAALVLMVLALWLARLGSRPVKALTQLVRRYTAGEYRDRAPALRFAEFNEFGQTLEHLAAEVQRQLSAVAEAERQRNQLDRLASEAELVSLRRQMQPHFLFNILNNLATMVTIDPAQSAIMITKLAELYRHTLETGSGATTPLERELHIVALYLELQRMRFGERLRFELAPPPTSELHVPSLLIQTLVENAVKHGISRAREGGRITVEVSSSGPAHYRCTVINTGGKLGAIASLDDADSRGAGHGLENTRKRLRLLYGDRGRFGLERNSRGETCAWFEFSGLPASVSEPGLITRGVITRGVVT